MTLPPGLALGPMKFSLLSVLVGWGKFTAHAISNDMETERSKRTRRLQKHSFTRQGITLCFLREEDTEFRIYGGTNE